MPRDAAKRMKPASAWAIVEENGDLAGLYWSSQPSIFVTRDLARRASNGATDERIARVEIRELPKRKRNAPTSDGTT